MVVLTPELTVEALNIIWAMIAGGTVWAYKTNQKATREESREHTKKVVMEMLKPALLESNAELIKTMNGTYLRSAEARIHFANIKEQLKDIKNGQVSIQTHLE